MADALGDIVYVCYGAALCFGIDLDNPSYELDEQFRREAHSTFNMLLSGWGDSLATHLEIKLEENDNYGTEVMLGTILSSAIGAADVLGIDIDAVVEAIHRSNLSKLGADGKPIYREDGKVLKGPNYTTPTADIKFILGV
jgi:predicted HAD superfamily Cof-like phosphohydrolase